MKKETLAVVAKEFPCMPCLRHPTCKHFDCMKSISHEDILGAAEPLLREKKSQRPADDEYTGGDCA
jgi:ADP-heptose:LPS heptosyltransferase